MGDYDSGGLSDYDNRMIDFDRRMFLEEQLVKAEDERDARHPAKREDVEALIEAAEFHNEACSFASAKALREAAARVKESTDG